MEKGKQPGFASKKQDGSKIGKKRKNGGNHQKARPQNKGKKYVKEDCVSSENIEADKKSVDDLEVEGNLEGASLPTEEDDAVDKTASQTPSKKFKGKKLNILKPKATGEGPKDSEEKNKEEKTDPNIKYVLFLGNLSYDVTQEAIEEHFKIVKEAIQDVRLLNDKETGRPRGCGFIQLETKKAYEKARKLHNSMMDGRKIRVEYTTPGSGKSQSRRKFITQKSKKLLRQKGKNKKKRNVKGIRT